MYSNVRSGTAKSAEHHHEALTRDDLFYIVEPVSELLGGLEASVLRAVAAPGDGPAYGLSVRRVVSEERGRAYSVGAIYTTLARLETKGLVASVASEPLAVRGGRSRREYVVTALGHQAMARARTAAARTWGFRFTEVTP